MTRLDILREKYEMECHNLMCFSKSLLMSEPKDGAEEQWTESKIKVSILENWIKELEEE